jgi:hypothetical protein
MRLFGRSEPDATPAEPRRITGSPHVHPELSHGEGASNGDGSARGATPVPGRLARLAAVVDGARRRRSDRDIRKIMQMLGMVAIIFGFVCILLGWYGASHSPYLYQEIPYLISGGLLGVALVIGGGVLVRCAWSLRQVEENRRNALAIVRSIDRLERILRNLDAVPGTDDELQEQN